MHTHTHTYIPGTSLHNAEIGLRVRFADRIRVLEKLLYADSCGGSGVITWVDPGMYVFICIYVYVYGP